MGQNNNNEEEDEIVLKSPSEIVQTVAEITAFDISAWWFIVFVFLTTVHDIYYKSVIVVVTLWCILQMSSSILKPNFKEQLFWSTISVIGYVLLFLLFGFMWSRFKLSYDIKHANIPKYIIGMLNACKQDRSCLQTVIDSELRSYVIQYIIMWPMSILKVLSKEPVKLVAEFVFEKVRFSYTNLVLYALDTSDAYDPVTWTSILLNILYVMLYVSFGVLWSFVKLYLDAYQDMLSKEKLEKETNLEFVKRIKWDIITWGITFPFSVCTTLLRHPLKVAIEFVFTILQTKYAYILDKAFENKKKV